MEAHTNTYRLNQGNKEYILTIEAIDNTIRITCKDSLNEKLLFSRDFSIEELKRLDSFFNMITSPMEALDYMDKALKMEKVGVSEENDSLKLNFFVTTQGEVRQLGIPLGETQQGGLNNFNTSSNEEQYMQTTNTTQTTFNLNQNYNLNDIYGQINEKTITKESLPVIGPVIEDENPNQYLSQFNTVTTTTTTDTNNNINTNDLNLVSELVDGNRNITSGAFDNNIYQETQNTYTTGFDNTENYLQNLQNEQISSDINTGLDTNIQYTNDFTKTADLNNLEQYTTTGTEDLTNLNIQNVETTQDINFQYIPDDNTQFNGGMQNTNIQYDYNTFSSSTPLNLQLGKNSGQFGEYKTTTYSKTKKSFRQPTLKSLTYDIPYITRAEDLGDNIDIKPSLKSPQMQAQTNNFYQSTQTTTTTKTTKSEPTFPTATVVSIPKQETKVFSLPLEREKEREREIVKKRFTDNQTQYDLRQEKKKPDPRINQLEGTTNSLKSEHQLIQDKLNALTRQLNEYKNQLSSMDNSGPETERSHLRAENKAMKQQLSELNKLRNDAAEVKFLRIKLRELDPLRRKVAEMEVLKRQLGELNLLKSKVAEYNNIKAQLGELNKLRLQVAQMNVLKQQLGELDSLRKKVAELNRVKSQLGELNNLRGQVGQINILKKQLDELTKLKISALDLEKLRLKIDELETIKLKYEQEILQLKAQQRTQMLQREMEKTKLTEMREMKNTGMDSKQLYIEEKTQQICVKGDIIRNTDELELLTRKINKSNQRLTLNLLYKATADTDKASAFHEKCDDARSTLVLIETDQGRRFGGYTSCSWSGDGIDKKDENAFVFSLDKMKIYDNIPGEDAIGCYPKFGPIFMGCQIRIYDDAFSKGGTTFEKGLNFNTEEDYELNEGERIFKVKEIEVYEVIPS